VDLEVNMTDYFVAVLKILDMANGSKTNIELAHEIADEFRGIVADEFESLIEDYRKGTQ
jgi:ABC-type ATPase with predicted acetyltransferase domain